MSRMLSFDPDVFTNAFGRSPLLVEHELADDPLLALSEIAKLADELPQTEEFVEHHVGSVPALVPGGSLAAPRLSLSAGELVRSIETNGCRMALRHIERIPRYRDLMERILGAVASVMPRRDGRMRKRESFLFLNSARSRVPVHADPEHNFLLQIKGTKTFRVGTFRDPTKVAPELERQYRGGTSYFSSMPDSFVDFVLEPGLALYVPPEAAHMVDNGPDVSISLSVTFRTRATERAIAVHRFNSRLRRLRVDPRPPGRFVALDTAKAAIMRQAIRARKLTRQAGEVAAPD